MALATRTPRDKASPKPRPPAKAKWLKIRIDPAEEASLAVLAECAGMRLTEYVRGMLGLQASQYGHKGTKRRRTARDTTPAAKTAPAGHQPPPPPSTEPASPPSFRAIMPKLR